MTTTTEPLWNPDTGDGSFFIEDGELLAIPGHVNTDRAVASFETWLQGREGFGPMQPWECVAENLWGTKVTSDWVLFHSDPNPEAAPYTVASIRIMPAFPPQPRDADVDRITGHDLAPPRALHPAESHLDHLDRLTKAGDRLALAAERLAAHTLAPHRPPPNITDVLEAIEEWENTK